MTRKETNERYIGKFKNKYLNATQELTLCYVCVHFKILNGWKPTATNFTGALD